MDIKEFWSYFISGFSYFTNKIPHTYDEWTSLFIMLTVIVTFFFITLPRAFSRKKGTKE